MILVGGIEVRTECNTKITTGTVVNSAQELGLFAACPPVFQNGNGIAANQAKAGNVNRVGRCVFAAPVLPKAVANNVAA